MRNTDCFRISQILLPQMLGFVTDKKNKIFIAPIGNVLRGFLFESTAGSGEDFYFWWFFMPICRPIEHLTLGYGDRLNVPGGYAGWRADMPDLPGKLLTAMMPKALPLMRSIHSLQDVIEAIYAHRGTRQDTDINVQDNIACMQILDGRFDEAGEMLDKIIDHERSDDQRAWVQSIVERMKGLRVKLLEDPNQAVDQVKAWQDYTFRALKLEKWR